MGYDSHGPGFIPRADRPVMGSPPGSFSPAFPALIGTAQFFIVQAAVCGSRSGRSWQYGQPPYGMPGVLQLFTVSPGAGPAWLCGPVAIAIGRSHTWSG